MLGKQHRNKKNCRARRIFKQRLPVLNMPWDPKDFHGRRPGTPLRSLSSGQRGRLSRLLAGKPPATYVDWSEASELPSPRAPSELVR